MYYFILTSRNKFKVQSAHKAQFVCDYFSISQLVDSAIVMNCRKNEKRTNAYKQVKENIDEIFVHSGLVDGVSLQRIYSSKIEANKRDKCFLMQAIDVLKKMNAADSNVYYQAIDYLNDIDPSPYVSSECALLAYKKGKFDEAVRLYEESIRLEKNNINKAERAYDIATVFYKDKKWSQARYYCQKATFFNKHYGAPYILIANMYAANPDWNVERGLNECTYFVAIDKLKLAKSVDPSCTALANRLISLYLLNCAKAKDLSMLGYKVGDRITIGGWIGETTTIR